MIRNIFLVNLKKVNLTLIKQKKIQKVEEMIT